jgi:hypothetical protein
MTKIKILITPIIALLLTSCANSLTTTATAESIQALDSVCMAFEDNSKPSWDHLKESGLDDLWRSFVSGDLTPPTNVHGLLEQ